MALKSITRPLHLARILTCSVLLAGTPFSTAHDFPFFQLDFGFQKKTDSRKLDPGLVRVSIVSRTAGGSEIEINGRLITDSVITQSFSLAGIVLDKENVMTFLGYRWLDIHNNDLSIEVSKEGRRWKGALVGIDQRNGVAVIKLAGANLRKARTCDDCEVKDGATIMAPASPEASRLFQAQIVSVGADGEKLVGVEATADPRGLVMTVDRPFPDVGLPVLTSDHRVLGFIASQDPLGLSYVVHPISRLVSSAERILKNKGDIFAGWLGLYLDDDPLADKGRGVFVQDVQADSPAQMAGLTRGDLLLRFNGHQVKDSGQFIELVEGSAVGSKASIEIVRQGSPITLNAQIAARRSAANRGRMSFNLPGAFGFPLSRVAPDPVPRNQRLLIGVNTILLDPPLAQVLQIPVQSGVLVTDVVKDSPAARSGILIGDIIVSIDGQAITDALGFISFLETHQWNERVLLQVNRKGTELTIPVLISE